MGLFKAFETKGKCTKNALKRSSRGLPYVKNYLKKKLLRSFITLKEIIQEMSAPKVRKFFQSFLKWLVTMAMAL